MSFPLVPVLLSSTAHHGNIQTVQRVDQDGVGTLTPSYADVVRSTDGSVASQ